jgi:hypothetical protein
MEDKSTGFGVSFLGLTQCPSRMWGLQQYWFPRVGRSGETGACAGATQQAHKAVCRAAPVQRASTGQGRGPALRGSLRFFLSGHGQAGDKYLLLHSVILPSQSPVPRSLQPRHTPGPSQRSST